SSGSLFQPAAFSSSLSFNAGPLSQIVVDGQESLAPQADVLLGKLESLEPPPQPQGRLTQRRAAGEQVNDQVAGVARACYQRLQPGQRQLRRETGEALGTGPSKPRNGRVDAPHRIPGLAAGLGAAVAVLRLAVRKAQHGGLVEDEADRVLDGPEQMPM